MGAPFRRLILNLKVTIGSLHLATYATLAWTFSACAADVRSLISSTCRSGLLTAPSPQILSFLPLFYSLSPSRLSPPPRSSDHLPTIFARSILAPNESWMWSVWGPKPLRRCHLSSWALPPCAKCLSWILNKPGDHLRASWSTALLLPSHYSAGGPGAPSRWKGFECVVMWAKLEIIGMAWVGPLKFSHTAPRDYQTFFLFFASPSSSSSTRQSFLKAHLLGLPANFETTSK